MDKIAVKISDQDRAAAAELCDKFLPLSRQEEVAEIIAKHMHPARQAMSQMVVSVCQEGNAETVRLNYGNVLLERDEALEEVRKLRRELEELRGRAKTSDDFPNPRENFKPSAPADLVLPKPTKVPTPPEWKRRLKP